jgi:hypothetical protein
MAVSTPVLDKTFLAQADMSTNQFRFVRGVADYTVGIITALGQRAIGVQQNLPNAAGKGTVVRMLGTSKLVMSAAVAAWSELTAAADGRGVAAAATNAVNAINTEASTAAGDVVEVIVFAGGGRLA